MKNLANAIQEGIAMVPAVLLNRIKLRDPRNENTFYNSYSSDITTERSISNRPFVILVKKQSGHNKSVTKVQRCFHCQKDWKVVGDKS